MAANTLQSPGVQVIETDSSLRIPSVTTSVGAIVVVAEKGPLNVPILIPDSATYVDTFGQPDDVNYEHFFTANAFLGGSNQLYVVRTENINLLCAGTTVGLSGGNLAIVPTPLPAGDYPLTYNNMSPHEAVDGSVNLLDTEIYHAFAIGAGPYYDQIAVSVITANDYGLLVLFKEQLAQAVSQQDIQTIAQTWYTGTPPTTSQYNPSYEQYLSNIPLLRDELIDPTDWSVNTSLLNTYVSFEFGPQVEVDSAGNPLGVLEQDQMAVYVFDETGALAESYVVSNNPAALNSSGQTMFAPTVINASSEYIFFFISDSPTDSAGTILYSTGRFNLMAADPLSTDLSVLTGEISEQWFANFTNPEAILIDLLLDPNYADDIKRTLDYIASQLRLDCFAVLSMPPDRMFNVNTGKPIAQPYTAMKLYVAGGDPLGSLNIDSSYSAIYGQYLQIFDNFNNVNRWVPASGYVAQVMVTIDATLAVWWPPAGLNRGIISNIVSIALNPTQAQRDVMYSNGINPIVKFSGQGITIWGQKTLTGVPSDFDRINVRRLFLYLERAISQMARFMLFEFNDSFTRSRFSSIVNNFLSGIVAKRGITDYDVVCDTTNNTPDVIDAKQFVAQILIKPNQAAEFITLTFTAVGQSLSFSEVLAGQ